MSQSAEQLWLKLASAGIVEGDPVGASELESPWYVKVMMAFFGWLAAIFVLGFIGLGIAFVIDSKAASFFVGALMIASAFAIFRSQNKIFLEHFGFAVSLAGQVLILWSLFEHLRFGTTEFWGSVAVFQIFLAILMPNFVHRVFSSFSASLALMVAFTSLGAGSFIPGLLLAGCCWLWLNEFRFPAYIRDIQAIGYGIVLALIPAKGSLLFPYTNLFWHKLRGRSEMSFPFWLDELILSLVLVYLIWQLTIKYRDSISARIPGAILLATLALAAISFEAPGITVGIVILLLGFFHSNRVLQSLGVVSLLFYSSTYYYLLESTLLVKALTLLLLGLILLSARWSMRWILAEKRESNHAG